MSATTTWGKAENNPRTSWWFIEAGSGSCAGTAHEAVFKAVARRLRGEKPELRGDLVGGPL